MYVVCDFWLKYYFDYVLCLYTLKINQNLNYRTKIKIIFLP